MVCFENNRCHVSESVALSLLLISFESIIDLALVRLRSRRKHAHSRFIQLELCATKYDDALLHSDTEADADAATLLTLRAESSLTTCCGDCGR